MVLSSSPSPMEVKYRTTNQLQLICGRTLKPGGYIWKRFGAFSIHTVPQIRTLKVTNNSTIPFNIVWHILNKHLKPQYPTVPFNILYDLYGLLNEENGTEDTFSSIRFVKYFGEECRMKREAFQVYPVELYLEPKQTGILTITLDSRNVRFVETNFVDLESLLIGHVYIHEMYRFFPNVFVRPLDTKLSPTRVQLLGRIEKPPFDFPHIHGDTSLSMSINDAIKLNIRQKMLRVVFKSTNKANIRINMKISEPFEIIRFKTIRCKCPSDVKCKCVVHFGECVEVLLKCNITNYLIMNLADVIYKGVQHYLKETTFFEDNSIKIIRHLNVYQQCQPVQDLTLDLTLFFPYLIVSPYILDFGMVYIGCTKTLSIQITNKTNSDTWWATVVSNNDVFSINPAEGVIPSVIYEQESLYLSASFRPNESVTREETVTITTCLPQYTIQIHLIGVGTFEEKHFIPPLIENFAVKKCYC